MIKDSVSVSLQKDEVHAFGCCLRRQDNYENQNSTVNPSRIRVYSEPRSISKKKINVTISKGSRSRSKQSQQTRQNQSKQRNNRNVDFKRTWEHSKIITTICSRPTSQKHSLVNSKITLNKELKIGKFTPQQKYQTITTGNTAKFIPEPKVSNQRNEMSSLNFLSEISKIDEEFISQQSATLNFLSFFNNIESKQQKKIPPKISKIIVNIGPNYLQSEKSIINPLERLMDRKRYECKLDKQKKKLVL